MEENQELNQEQEQQEQERTFTQAEVDAIINKRVARMKKDLPSDEELAAFREYQKAQKPKDEASKLKDLADERDSYQTELEMIRRENFLLRHGVDADDVDYYVYKITKAMDDDEEFDDAAKKFLKEHKPKAGVRVDMGGRLNGSGGGKKTANETMNDLLRAARG